MENWLYHKPTVDSFAVHYETGEPLPADIFEKIKGLGCASIRTSGGSGELFEEVTSEAAVSSWPPP